MPAILHALFLKYPNIALNDLLKLFAPKSQSLLSIRGGGGESIYEINIFGLFFGLFF